MTNCLKFIKDVFASFWNFLKRNGKKVIVLIVTVICALFAAMFKIKYTESKDEKLKKSVNEVKGFVKDVEKKTEEMEKIIKEEKDSVKSKKAKTDNEYDKSVKERKELAEEAGFKKKNKK